MNEVYNNFIKDFEKYQLSNNYCLPYAIIFQPQVYTELSSIKSMPFWFQRISKIVDKDLTTPWKFIDFPIVRQLRHEKCCICGLVDVKTNFHHKIDERPLCDYCFNNAFMPDKERMRFVRKNNEYIRKSMNENYLKVFEKILFGEKE